ncbi:Glycosyltransferase involved in cell wall bisynthesis [Singulisphaera sp. GP187]|uniref:glycosyltransferase n=1 Tax=Singulisphaera sp. GP187 TaxID=1882752 RepID=UPI00092BF923|nr:glycosyltransferase [Singulisphaera sp. GP187]SIO55275.1 Glycosyltransferase involved in cell wall bisynthesis [Singulisphaera sp. GP187]
METIQVTYTVDEKVGGPAQSVPALCGALEASGARSTLHVVAPAPEALARRIRLVVHPQWRFPHPRLGISPAMRRALYAAVATADIIHVHGLWQMPNVYPSWAARKTKCQVVVSPRGSFSPWALKRSSLRKRSIWLACQGRAVRQAALLHATSEAEAQDMRDFGLRAPIAVIPNGVTLPDRVVARRAADGPRRLLYLSRVHPSKGLDFLIRSWRSVQDTAPDWTLDIVGGEDQKGYQAELEGLAREIGAERVAFHGALFGERKAEAFRRADLFVLPTHFENFGMSVAEALAYEVPVIVTRRAPWAGVEANRCGWWIEFGQDPLTESLRDALAQPPDALRAMGQRGRDWMEKDFSWNRMGQMMHETYLWVVGGGTPPAWVRSGI